MKASVSKIIGINILVFLSLVLLIEAGLQLIAVIRPSYDVLFVQPDAVVGWKQVPNFRWTSADADFSVDVQINSLGFRDLERELIKPQGVTRVAVLGDSFIEAIQVPLAKTGTQLLERRLNTPPSTEIAGHSQRWEVLNFGISNHGVGQYLLTWEQYASKYHPDYVAIFVAKVHMKYTMAKYEYGAFPTTRENRLWVRPTFRIDKDSLIREPAKDYETFVRFQENLIKTGFAGKRTRRRRPGLLTAYYGRLVLSAFTRLVGGADRPVGQIAAPLKATPVTDDELFAVNLKVIEELGRQVQAGGSRLVVLDASRYFGDDERVSRILSDASAKNGFGYVPLYEELLKSDANGVSTHWVHNAHFNETGNRVVANSLYDWLAALHVSGAR